MKAHIPTEARFAIELAARLLTGPKKRRYAAEITNTFLDGSARKAEREFGWSRDMVFTGQRELSTGIECIDGYSFRGNKPTEEKCQELEKDIHDLIDPKSQVDPQFKNGFRYTRITAKAVRQALIEIKGYKDEELPTENTIGNILNRLGYCLKRVQKTKPKKKTQETDQIFENVHAVNEAADRGEKTLRISVDTKAKVNIGPFSRGGKSREKETPEGQDHDTEPDAKLVPVGIFVPSSDQLTITFGTSVETSDFIVDCLDSWWNENQGLYSEIKELVINLDCGPHVQSHRTQFIKRIVQFSDKTELSIHLAYYPPYHSKYNPIEHCWGGLERHWNVALLDTVDKAIEWAKTMTWNGVYTVVNLADKTYKHGVSVAKSTMEYFESRLKRSSSLPKWDLIITPACG